MLGDMFLWLVANLKQGVIYLVKQACGNDILASVYIFEAQKLWILEFLTLKIDIDLTVYDTLNLRVLQK